MRNKDISYPYPVMGINDDFIVKPSAAATVDVNRASYNVHLEMCMENEEILALVEDGSAVFTCEVDCPTTFYRKVFTSKSPSLDIEIGRREVARRVSFDCTVTATRRIEGYSNRQFHEDYVGFKFNLEPGDILAFVDRLHYDADIKYDKLNSAGSFLSIVEGNDEEYTLYYLLHDRIEVQLPHALFEDYKKSFNGEGSHATIFHSSIVYNALVFALMEYNEDLHKDKLWARTINYRIELEPRLQRFKDTLKLKDEAEILLLAQTLLANPYKRLMETMHVILNQPTGQIGY